MEASETDLSRSLTENQENGPEDLQSLKTSWENHSSCGLRLAYFPEGDFWIWNHWVVRPGKPIWLFVILLLITGIGIYDLFEYTVPRIGRIIFSIFLFGSMICLILSYFLQIAKGPGYLPFNYSYTKNNNMSWEEEMTAIVVNKAQQNLAKKSPHPARSAFSIIARRYVLRADHYCIWSNTYIGIRNHRFFTLMMIWTIIYILVFYTSHSWFYRYLFHPFQWPQIVTVVCMLVLLIPFSYALYHLYYTMKNLANNVTSREVYKNEDIGKYDKGCFTNFAEVCGQKKFSPLWIWPCFDFEPMESGLSYQTFSDDNKDVL